MKTRKSRARGFSLLEILIATIVIAIALFGVLSMSLHTSRTKESLREYEVAREAASRKIEEIRGLPWGKVATAGVSNPPDPNQPTVCFNYAAGTGLPRNVKAPYSPFSVDGLSNPNTTDKKGEGTVIIHGTNPNSAGVALVDPVFLIDYEVLIVWKGIGGWSRYSARNMLAKDQGK